MSDTAANGELLRVERLTKHFPVTRGVFGKTVGLVRAVDDVSFEIAPGETLGLVGESGSGKTTVGRAILRLVEPTSGRVLFEGADLAAAGADELRVLRRHLQVIFQDPYSSLNPRHRVIDIVGEPLEVHGLYRGAAIERRVLELLTRVGLSAAHLNRYPHEFSGGQRQRIGIARALALEPRLVICDEPVSALDVSIQAQVVNLLQELRRELGLAYLFIAHDLSVVRHLSHRVAVMYLGELVEIAPVKRLFAAPAHPYTRALLAAIPVPDPTEPRRRLVLTGDIPSPLAPPAGCRFHTRCPAVMDRCKSEPPPSYEVEGGHAVRCFHAEGAAGDDWFRLVDERIEARVRENEQRTPPPPRVALPEEAPATLAAEAAPPMRPAEAEHPEGAATWRRTQRLAALARRHPLAAILVLVLFVVTLRFGKTRLEVRTAGHELDAIAEALDARSRLAGAYPATLDELGWRLPPIVGGTEAVDAWGRTLRYRAPGPDGARFEIRSLGPDGVPSGDDLVRR
ncbi:MAG TPA: oligopeptide/dipeptide ABC transporter ATP-binding protein [Polyangiaceae bacterium]